MKFVVGNYSVKFWGVQINLPRIDVAILLVLLIVSFGPRLIGLGTFLTADEKTWIVRSYEFIRAFKDLRFNDMLQTTHPGVTTLWMSGIAITTKMFIGHSPFTTNALIYFIKSAQFPIVLINSLAVVLLYVLMKKMAGRAVACIAALFIALDPFIIGYSRVIHVDALLGSFLTLSIIATILYARNLERRYLIASSLCAALALLTKIPAIFIVPFFITAIVIFQYKKLLKFDFFVERTKDTILWVLTVALGIVIIWPALLWVPNPVGNVLAIQRDVTVAATTPHNMTEEYSLKPLHYLEALLDRSNPINLIGGIIGLVGISFLVFKKKMPREMLLIAIYLFGFVLMMTLGAKKGDRYIMPAFFALNILAAFGFAWGFSLLTALRKKVPVLIGILVAYLMVVVISYHPYEIAYSNPFFPDNLSQELGWGEGLDQVATWLNAHYPTAKVASWYPEELGAYTAGTVLHINAHMQNQVRFVVLYKNMFGREPSHYANDFIDEYYKKQKPVYVAHIHGKEFAWVYEKPTYLNTVGDLDSKTIAVQEVAVSHEGLAGLDILPATRSGNAVTGTFVVDVASSLTGNALFTKEFPIADIADATWLPVQFPDSISILKGEHLFIRIHTRGASAPFASLKYSQEALRMTPIYISRTNSLMDAHAKTGSLAVRLTYHAIDGTIATEYQEKLLR